MRAHTRRCACTYMHTGVSACDALMCTCVHTRVSVHVCVMLSVTPGSPQDAKVTSAHVCLFGNQVPATGLARRQRRGPGSKPGASGIEKKTPRPPGTPPEFGGRSKPSAALPPRHALTHGVSRGRGPRVPGGLAVALPGLRLARACFLPRFSCERAAMASPSMLPPNPAAAANRLQVQ